MSTGYYAELSEQPDVIRQCVAHMNEQWTALLPLLERFRRGEFQRIVFSGMGGSFAAAHVCALRLIEQHIPAMVIEASELLYYQRALLEPGTLLILISQSGYSVEVVRLLDGIGPTIPVIGITNDPTSDLARRSTVVLSLRAGLEETVSTKTYTSTLALLHMLSAAFIDGNLAKETNELQQTAESLRDWLPRWEKRAAEIVQTIQVPKFVVFLGRGFSRASAMTGALITKETAKLPTEGMIGGQFRHGPIEVVEQGITVVIFAYPGRTESIHGPLSQRITELGGQVISIGAALPGALAIETPASHELLAPLIEIVPVQYIAAALAAKRGFEVGAFRYSQKVTVIE